MGFKVVDQGRGYTVIDTIPNRDGGEYVRFNDHSMLAKQVRIAEQYAKGHGGAMKPTGLPLLRIAFGYYLEDRKLSDAMHCRRLNALFLKWDKHRDTTPVIPITPVPPDVPGVPTVPEPASIVGLAFGALVVGVVAFRGRRSR